MLEKSSLSASVDEDKSHDWGKGVNIYSIMNIQWVFYLLSSFAQYYQKYFWNVVHFYPPAIKKIIDHKVIILK